MKKIFRLILIVGVVVASVLTLNLGHVFVILVKLAAEDDKRKSFQKHRSLLIFLFFRGEDAQATGLIK